MTSTAKFNVWKDLTNNILAEAIDGKLHVKEPQQDFASFGSTVAVELGTTTPVKITYDRTLYASTNMKWAFATAVGGLPAYNWEHSKTGFYRLTYWARTTNDVWRVMSVCKNDSFTDAVGTSARTGAAGGYGYSAELIYRVDSISDSYALFAWASSASSAQSAFSGTPPNGFISTPQDGGSAPSDGYFITFNISRVSSL